MTRTESHSYGLVVPLPEVEDLKQLSVDLQSFLKSQSNLDLSIYTPQVVKPFTGNIIDVEHNLMDLKNSFSVGKMEHFVTFIGAHAVGMAVVTNTIDSPKGIDHQWPNVSEYILNPYRGLGLGTLTVKRCLEAVHENFGGHAWAYVRTGNTAAERLLQQTGFVMLRNRVTEQGDKHFYIHGK